VKDTDELTGEDFEFISHGGLEFELNAVDIVGVWRSDCNRGR
jgi:hypothetical protein